MDIIEKVNHWSAMAKLTSSQESVLSAYQLDAIAEAFRALEQNAQAAEAELAERDKQEPVACKKRLVNHRSGIEHHWTYHGEVDKASQGDIFRVEVVPLYARPAPALNLADLVPDEISLNKAVEAVSNLSHESLVGSYQDGWDSCRAAILRNIEEANIPAEKVGSVADTEVQAGSEASDKGK